jgi:hypothetical protein
MADMAAALACTICCNGALDKAEGGGAGDEGGPYICCNEGVQKAKLASAHMKILDYLILSIFCVIFLANLI